MANRRELAETNPVKLTIADRITELVFRFPNIHNFSAAIGVSEANTENWLNGDSSPGVRSLYHLCCTAHVSMAWLLGIAETEQYAGLDFTERDNAYDILLDRLKELIGEYESVSDFAAKVHIGRLSVYRWLSGDSVPNAETIYSICTKCCVSPDWLVGLAENPGRLIVPVRRDDP